jgi:HSP20 family protein
MRTFLPALSSNLSSNFRDFDKVFADFFDDSNLAKRLAWDREYELVRKKDSYDMMIDLPGFKPDNVKLDLDGSTLHIEAHRNKETRKEDETVLVTTRSSDSWNQSFQLSDDIDRSGIDAKFEHGVLTLHMKRKQVTSPQRIAISAPKSIH